MGVAALRRPARAAAAAAVLGLGAVLPGEIAQYPVRDHENGWSIRPILGWDARPPNLPGVKGEGRVVGGWFPSDTTNPSYGAALAFGSFFDDAAAVKSPPAPAPEKGRAWLCRFLARLRGMDDPWVIFDDDMKARTFGQDPGWLYEGTLRALKIPDSTSDIGYRLGAFRVLAAAVRRGDFEVLSLYLLEEGRGAPPALESALSLRILDQRDMALRRTELEAKERLAGKGDEAWFARIRARVPAGWKCFRRGRMVFLHDGRVSATSVENMAARLETMRKRVYEVMYPPVEDPEAEGAVVKVTRDVRQYLSYGAPENTLGYWSARDRELVLYFDSDSGWLTDQEAAQSTLFHEGFHQYLFHALGGFSAHPWFEEGHGDYFGGWTARDGVPRKGTLQLRQETIDRILERDSWTPMEDFLSLDWDAFYGRGEDAVPDVGEAYAQAWSVVTFLRDGPRKKLLDAYFGELKAAVAEWRKGEAAAAAREGRPVRPAYAVPAKEARALRERALRKAFAGVDFEQLEQSWLDWLTR